MEKSEMIWIASYAIAKNMDYETLKYCDYMYGKEHLTDEVWIYVEECREIGEKQFYGRYSEEGYKLY